MWSIENVSEEDQATETGNMHKKFGKDHACGSGDNPHGRTDRQTDHRQTYSSQYFATAPTGEVMTTMNLPYNTGFYTNAFATGQRL